MTEIIDSTTKSFDRSRYSRTKLAARFEYEDSHSKAAADIDKFS